MANVITLNLNRLEFSIPSPVIELCKDLKVQDSMVFEASVGEGKTAQVQINRFEESYKFHVEGVSTSVLQLLDDGCHCMVKSVCGVIYHMTAQEEDDEAESSLAEVLSPDFCIEGPLTDAIARPEEETAADVVNSNEDDDLQQAMMAAAIAEKVLAQQGGNASMEITQPISTENIKFEVNSDGESHVEVTNSLTVEEEDEVIVEECEEGIPIPQVQEETVFYNSQEAVDTPVQESPSNQLITPKIEPEPPFVITPKPEYTATPEFIGTFLGINEIPWRVANINAYQCYMCDAKYVKLQQLRTHVPRKHKYRFESTHVTPTVMQNAYICNLCQHVSPNDSSMRKHVRYVHKMIVATAQGRGRRVIHPSMPGHKCSLCPMKSVSLKALKQHVRRLHKHHPGYADACRYIQELQIESCARKNTRWKTRVHCPACLKECPAWWLKRHISMFHADDPNLEDLKKEAKEICYREAPVRQMTQCPKCYMQIRQGSMATHLKFACQRKPMVDTEESTAEGKKLYKCGVCARTFMSQRAVRLHKGVAHKVCTDADGNPIEFISCEVCSKQFKTKGKLNEHMKCHSAEKKFACDLCGKKFKYKASVGEHKRIIHNRDFKYPCLLCGRNFDKPRRLDTHQCYPIKSEVDEDGQEKENKYIRAMRSTPHSYQIRSDGRIECDVCNNWYPKRDFSSHRRRVHRIAVYKDITLFTCKMCGKEFTRHHHLLQHMTVHSEARQFACEKCGRKFKNETSKVEHYRSIHLRQFRHHCPHCGKAFYRPNRLEKHQALCMAAFVTVKRENAQDEQIQDNEVQDQHDQEEEMDEEDDVDDEGDGGNYEDIEGQIVGEVYIQEIDDEGEEDKNIEKKSNNATVIIQETNNEIQTIVEKQ